MARIRTQHWLARAAQLHPDRVAVDSPDGVLTYAQLFLASGALATALNDEHDVLMPVTRVGIELPPSAAFAIALHAVWAQTLVAVPIDARLPAEQRALRLADCAAVIGEDTVAPYLDDIASPDEARDFTANYFAQREEAEHSGMRSMVPPGVEPPPTFWHPVGAELNPEPDDRDEGDVVLWTSGSTGPGTEVLLTFENLLWNAIGSAAALGQPANERWLSAMPVAHVGGLTVFTRSAIGATTAVVRPTFDVHEQVDLLMRGEATITSVVPTMLGRMLDAGLDHPPNLRLVLLGGAPITPELLARAEAAGVPVTGTYGMTEACSQIITAGAPLFCTDVALRGELVGIDGDEDPARAEELMVRGPTIALSAATTSQGWLATGDRGARLPDGSLTVVGRLAETIITGGENVAPTEVEAHLVAQPGIADAAVLGIPDPEWGERIEARVVLADGAPLDEDAIRTALRAALPPFAIPKAITAVDALPRTPTGKLRRRDLR